jgi:hypothetical protein
VRGVGVDCAGGHFAILVGGVGVRGLGPRGA